MFVNLTQQVITTFAVLAAQLTAPSHALAQQTFDTVCIRRVQSELIERGSRGSARTGPSQSTIIASSTQNGSITHNLQTGAVRITDIVNGHAVYSYSVTMGFEPGRPAIGPATRTGTPVTDYTPSMRQLDMIIYRRNAAGCVR